MTGVVGQVANLPGQISNLPHDIHYLRTNKLAEMWANTQQLTPYFACPCRRHR